MKFVKKTILTPLIIYIFLLNKVFAQIPVLSPDSLTSEASSVVKQILRISVFLIGPIGLIMIFIGTIYIIKSFLNRNEIEKRKILKTGLIGLFGGIILIVILLIILFIVQYIVA